ncbi:hypothetical protein GJ496_004392 [Pomphorhynchus laevis]|nr:hypothetical protein GJ496_004392 [Pomphorhynchus laevis]
MLISRIIKQKRIVDSDDEESLSTLVWDDLSEIIHKSSLTSIGSMSTIDDLQSLASQARTSDDQNSICTNECMNDDVTICAEIDNSPQTNTDNMQTNADMVTIEETAPPELPLPSPLPPPPPLPPSLSGMLSGNGINTSKLIYSLTFIFNF